MTQTQTAAGEFTTPRIEFAAALRVCKKLATRHGAVHITAADGNAYMLAGAADYVRHRLTGTIVADGINISIPLVELETTIKESEGRSLRLVQVTDDKLIIASGADVETVDASPVGTPAGHVTYEPQKVLCTLGPPSIDVLIRAAFAASRDQSRPILCGLLLERPKGKTATVTCTDSYRLARFHLPAQLPEGVSLLVPAAELLMALKTVNVKEGHGARFGIAGQRIIIDTGASQWSIGEITGTFPDYRSLMSDSFDYGAEIPRQELADLMKAFANDLPKDKPVRCRMDLPTHLELKGDVLVDPNEPKGRVEPHREKVTWHDDEAIDVPEQEMWIGLNPQYAREALEAFTGDTVMLEWISTLRPLRLMDDAGNWVLQMPIRISQEGQ